MKHQTLGHKDDSALGPERLYPEKFTTCSTDMGLIQESSSSLLTLWDSFSHKNTQKTNIEKKICKREEEKTISHSPSRGLTVGFPGTGINALRVPEPYQGSSKGKLGIPPPLERRGTILRILTAYTLIRTERTL